MRLPRYSPKTTYDQSNLYWKQHYAFHGNLDAVGLTQPSFLLFNKHYFFLLLFLSLALSQSYSLKGQFWTRALTSNDDPGGRSSIESTMGYIPTLSLFKELSNNQLVDMEWAYRFNRTYSGDSLFNNNESHHRYWVRYSSEKLEARLGLQKIVFGPSFVLRSLSWLIPLI